MSRWKIKGCPKCGGDLFEETISGDREICCLQCGYVIPRSTCSGGEHASADSGAAEATGRRIAPGGVASLASFGRVRETVVSSPF